MKIMRKDEQLIKTGCRLPAGLKKAIEAKAVSERRSVNDQVIVLLEAAMELEKTNGGTK
jgi:hypothetical protein